MGMKTSVLDSDKTEVMTLVNGEKLASVEIKDS